MSYYGFTATDLAAGSSPNRGLGSVADDTPDSHIDVMASASFAQDVWTGAVSSTGPTDLDYTGPDSVAQTYTIAASATAAGVLASIAAAEQADSALTFLSEYNVTASGTTLVATAKDPSVVGTLASSTNLAWTHTTTGAEGSDLPLARAVLRAGYGSGVAALGNWRAGLMSEVGDQVITGTVVYAANAAYNIKITLKNWLNGEDYTLPTVVVVANTDDATTRGDIVTQLNTDLPANTFLAASGSGGVFTLTAEVSGLVANVVAWSTVEAGTCTIVYTTGAPGAAGYDADAAILGVVEQSTKITYDSSGNPILPKRQIGPVVRGPASILVDPTDTPTAGGSVWVGTGSSNAGKFAGAAGANLAPLSGDSFRWGPAEGNYQRLHILRRLQ